MWDLFAKTVSTLLGKTNVCQLAAKNEAYAISVCVCARSLTCHYPSVRPGPGPGPIGNHSV